MNTSAQFLVTGANGYLASWIVKQLLESDHSVRGSVRSDPHSDGYGHLHQLAASHPGRLTLHRGPLASGTDFVPLVTGCDYVIHTASPFLLGTVEDPSGELLRPAVEGTREVLRAAAQVKSVRRVVLTSSAAAVYGDSADGRALKCRGFSEEDWNTTSSLNHQPYAYSKTRAERAAWEIAESQNRWQLVVLNPGFMLGPPLSIQAAGVSHTIMRNFADGTYRKGIVDLWYGLVDVRDVAEAHIRACTAQAARGRYLLSAQDASLWDISQRLRRLFGETHPLPRRKAPKAVLWLLAPKFGFTRRYVARNIGIPIHLDATKSRRDLHLRYRPLDDTLRDHFQAALSGIPASTAAPV